MVRSLWSGVSGMKAHQTRMDVIGNNISNVNTYGFKSSRATFRDVYYQSMRGAAQGSSTKGGLNPSQVGYGATIGSVDVMQTQSIKSTTGNPLDVSIAGDGFFQVMDGDGNIYYTKAGMLNIDEYGNLIDSNGCFVLGTNGSPVGKAPDSSKIQFSIPPVNPTQASAENTINNIKYTVTAGQTNADGNVSINFLSGNLPANQKASATISSTGIAVTLNSDETFADLDALQTAVNDAIRAANGGKEHPGGPFTINMEPSTSFNNLTGAQIVQGSGGVTPGTVTLNPAVEALFKCKSTGESFNGTGNASFDVKDVTSSATGVTPTPSDAKRTYEITVSIAGGGTYTGRITSDQLNTAGKEIMLKGPGGTGDTMTLTCPSEKNMLDTMADQTVPGTLDTDANGDYTFGTWIGVNGTGTVASTPSTPSKNLGLGEKPFKLEKGTEGGVQTVGDLSGIQIGADGVIRATHPNLGDLEIGRIDLAMFDNPSGLEQVGNTYFAATVNSGDPKRTQPGVGGTGNLAASSLEMSNVDLSQEFADMITTQRGFQANSRIITVSDTMLEELINLKR